MNPVDELEDQVHLRSRRKERIDKISSEAFEFINSLKNSPNISTRVGPSYQLERPPFSSRFKRFSPTAAPQGTNETLDKS